MFHFLNLLLAALFLLWVGPASGQDRWPSNADQPDANFAYRAGGSTLNKFGFNDDVPNSEESVWEGDDFSGPARCPADTSAFTLYASSSNGGDTQTMTVEGVDSNWDALSVDITLTGQTAVQVGSASQWLRVNRAFNTGSSDFSGTIYLHIDSVPTAGVPDNPSTDIKTVINAGENQTLQSCYTVPDGKFLYLAKWCISNIGSGGAEVNFRLRLTEENGSSRVQELVTIGNPDAWCSQYVAAVRYVPRSMLEVTAERASAGSSDTTGTFNGYLLSR